MRPKSIELFEKVYLLSIVLSMFGPKRMYPVTEMAFSQTGVDAPIVGQALIAGVVLGFLIPLLLWYFIARRASNVAQWILIALTALGLLSFVAGLADPARTKGMLLAGSVVITALTLYAVWLLFRPDAKAWLGSKGTESPTDPHTSA